MLNLIHEQDSAIAVTLLPWQSPEGLKKTLCIAKQAYHYSTQKQAWVPNPKAPDFIWTDDWTDNVNRQRSDILGIKPQCEILLQGAVQSGLCLRYQEGDEHRVLMRVGTLAKEPVLYWQSDWKKPAGKKSLSSNLVAPSYARLNRGLEGGHLSFEGVFLEGYLPFKTQFPVKQIWPNLNLVLPGLKKAYTWVQDTIQINTEAASIACLAKAYVDWDCLSDRQACLVVKP